MGNLGLKGSEGFKTLEWKLGDIDSKRTRASVPFLKTCWLDRKHGLNPANVQT